MSFGTSDRSGCESANRAGRLPTISLAVLAVVLLAPVAGVAAKVGIAPGMREVVDETGRKVQVPQQAQRVISLAPNLTEIVFALGDADHLVADTSFCDFPPEAKAKPHVGGPVNPNLERIAALMPDLILATSLNRRETVSALDRMGLPVYVTDPQSVSEMIASVRRLGDALGVKDKAVVASEQLRGRMAALQLRLAERKPRRVLFVVWSSPLISVGQNTFIADALRLAGGVSVIHTRQEWPRVGLEAVVKLQPDFVVFAAAHASSTKLEIEQLRTEPGWRDLDAVRENRIAVVSDAINRPAPRMMDAVEELARVLHPEAF